MAELVHWADIVDGALYESPQAAVEMAGAGDEADADHRVDAGSAVYSAADSALTRMPLQEVLDQPLVASLLGPLLERHQQAIELIATRAESKEGTIYFDITDRPMEGYNKFIPYYLHPEATYSVGLSKSSFQDEGFGGVESVDEDGPEKMLNLAAICERYGGGGHARVGAISFSPDREDEARKAAAEIVAELRAKNPLA